MKLESLSLSKFQQLNSSQIRNIMGGQVVQLPSVSITTCRTGDDNQHSDSDNGYMDAEQQIPPTAGNEWFHETTTQVVDMIIWKVDTDHVRFG